MHHSHNLFTPLLRNVRTNANLKSNKNQFFHLPKLSEFFALSFSILTAFFWIYHAYISIYIYSVYTKD